jgi:hypothetical protein
MNRRRVVTGVRIAGVGAVCGLALLLAVRLQARGADMKLEDEFTRKVGPLDPAAYASPSVPDGENAALWLRAAAAALTLSEADRGLIGDLSWLRPDEWTAEQETAIERVFSRNAPALAMAERASTLPRSTLLLSGPEATNAKYQSSFLDLIRLARMIDQRARLAVKQRDWPVFRSGVAELACLGASLESESPLIGQLVGVACERMMFDAILVAMRSPATDRAALQGLDATIPRIDLAASWRRALGALAAGVHSGIVNPRDMFDQGSTNLEMAVPSPEEYLRIVLGIEGLAARPLGLDPALADRLEKSKGLHKGRPTGDTLASSLVRYQSLLTLRRMARIAIALRLAALDNGRYPGTLGAWSEASTPDPFTGGPLRYELRADGSAVISVPGAEELFNKINELKTSMPYTWVLPAPGSGVPPSKK